MPEIAFLGTAAALRLPSFHCSCAICEATRQGAIARRTRSALAIIDSQTTLIDAGPDIAEQLERESIQKVDAILITHWHFDHIAGLGEFHEAAFIHKWEKLPLYTPASGLVHLEQELSYMKKTCDLRVIEAGMTLNIGLLRYIPVKTSHFKDSVGFIIEGKRRIAYLGDGVRPPDDTLELLSGVDLLILEATMDELDAEGWHNLDIAGAIEVWKEIGSRECILTHMSFHSWRDGALIAGFDEDRRTDVLRENPGLKMAYDGLRIPF